MPDIDNAANGQGAGGEGAGADTENKGAAGQDQGGQGQDGAGDDGAGDGDGGEGDQADKGDGGEGDDKKPKDDGSEPETRKRKTAKDYIIERKNRQIEKAKAGTDGKKPKEDDGAGDDGDDEGDDDEEINPEDAKLISKVVDAKLAPVLKQQQEAEDEAEVKQFIAANPEFAPYEAKAKRFMQHPSRAHLPIKSIFYEVAGDDLLKIGAARAKAAEKEARKGQAGGGSSRTVEGEKSVNEMSPAEFKKLQDSVRLKHGDR